MKTAIVTGASGNLGKAVVKKLIDEGYQVTGTKTSNGKNETGLPADKYNEVTVDLTNEQAAQKFIDDITNKQAVDVAVLTAGGFAIGDTSKTKITDIKKQYEINFETAYNVAQPAFQHMLQRKSGKIFLIGSKAGLDTRDGKNMIAYTLSKSLLFRLAELMNNEAKNTGVSVSVVVPSTIDTPQNREAMPGADFSKWIKPEAIADIIYWYASDEAAAIKNAVIEV